MGEQGARKSSFWKALGGQLLLADALTRHPIEGRPDGAASQLEHGMG